MTRRMILLVSGQPMANLLAALEPSLGVGEVDLVVTGDMQAGGKGDRLVEVLEGRGLACRWHSVSDPYDPEATRRPVAALLARDSETTVVNLTGGTKPMALGAHRAAVEAGVRDILYLVEDGRFRWLEGQRPPFPVGASLSVAEVVRAHGFGVVGSVAPSPQRIATARALDPLLTGGTLHGWNRLMAAVEKTSRKRKLWTPALVPLDAAISSSPEALPLDRDALRRAVALGDDAGLCRLVGEGLVVGNSLCHAFLAGGWFEHLLFDVLTTRASTLGLGDIRANLEVEDAAGARNEIDAAAMRGRSLLLFECKTVRFGRDTGEKAANILYRLEHLRALGGLGTRALLVSRDPVEGKVRKAFEGEGIGLVDGVTGATLGERLAEALGRLS
ncbi:Card1-like endonuclease domain-containing protein [Thermaurantiacus tibetensis]|uniref:Card1-like endonuclease domain-containing protein n=1 Tax=Thermaurantiacus tibetensis TaxID=2759035 RepID=UPI00188EA7F7|nr:DUF1887 family CARF protein [Thermaurantiacus tibetensis]